MNTTLNIVNGLSYHAQSRKVIDELSDKKSVLFLTTLSPTTMLHAIKQQLKCFTLVPEKSFKILSYDGIETLINTVNNSDYDVIIVDNVIHKYNIELLKHLSNTLDMIKKDVSLHIYITVNSYQHFVKEVKQTELLKQIDNLYHITQHDSSFNINQIDIDSGDYIGDVLLYDCVLNIKYGVTYSKQRNTILWNK